MKELRGRRLSDSAKSSLNPIDDSRNQFDFVAVLVTSPICLRRAKTAKAARYKYCKGRREKGEGLLSVLPIQTCSFATLLAAVAVIAFQSIILNRY